MSAAFTPGPWVLAEVVENRFQKTNMRRVRSAQEGTEHGAVCEVYGARDGSVAAANAHLIAAAPEMLAALLALMSAYYSADTPEGADVADYEAALSLAGSAIAKATGGAS